jgi:hypothetical protein
VPSLVGEQVPGEGKEHMASSGLIRRGAIGFMLGGATWAVLGLSAVFGYLQAIPGREDVVLFVVALLLTAAGLVALHALQGESYGLLGRVGFYVALAAITARVLGAVVFLAGSSALEWLSLPGTVGMTVGFVLYGLATLQAGVLPRWYGVVLIVCMPVSLPLAVYGTALFGLILVVLGYGLWLRKDAATTQPPRVR